MQQPLHSRSYLTFAFVGVALMLVVATFAILAADGGTSSMPDRNAFHTTTPIKHIVVIFQENVSFDHYFATYPDAKNPPGEPVFHAQPGTPSVNGLSGVLLTDNPNLDNPQRLDRSQAMTCDQDHAYTDEQKAYDHGLVDQFVQSVAGSKCADKSTVLDYFDGNTVTALWNYAQHNALNDNSFDTEFGPSTPGALDLISGQTHGATPANVASSEEAIVANGTVLNDLDPTYDDCSSGNTAALSGKNIGDLLNADNITWGWFEGGFAPSATSSGKAVCGTAHQNIGGAKVVDYVQHHEPFQYYLSTANPHHLPPSSVAMIGKTDQANHQYDLSAFWKAIANGTMPAVSFLKAPAYQDGHAGYSDPLDEQHFLVDTINQLEKSPFWSDTAIVIAYDDSDGWYDHVMPPIVNQSSNSNDALSNPGACGMASASADEGRCGYGPRLPLLVISPYAKANDVDNTLTDQTSILRFIEDNWGLGRIGDQSFDAKAGTLNNMFNFTSGSNPPIFLDPNTGENT